MNWWLLFQISRGLAQISCPPDGYLLRDDTFFAQSFSHQVLQLDKPDTLLLDLTLFQATNQARREVGLPLLQYDRALYQAARSHAESMIRHDYVSHQDMYSLSELTLSRRIQKQTDKFERTAENIGQYQTIDTPDWYGVRFNSRTQRYEYIDTDSKKLYHPYTYAEYARYAVVQWLNSPHHRTNLLNPLFTHVGCAVRLSTNSYKERRAPFGRLVQNFGTQHMTAQTSR